MNISNNVINQFVKNSNTSKTKKESFVYGKLGRKEVDKNGKLKYYVIIDGSTIETPISHFTATVDPDERVIVMIKNRSAIITGNISSASASSSYVDAQIEDKVGFIDSIGDAYIESLWEGYFNE